MCIYVCIHPHKHTASQPASVFKLRDIKHVRIFSPNRKFIPIIKMQYTSLTSNFRLIFSVSDTFLIHTLVPSPAW